MTMPFHFTVSREVNIISVAMLLLNLIVLIFGGGMAYSKIQSAYDLAAQDRISIMGLQSHAAVTDLLVQRHEDYIEQLYLKEYGIRLPPHDEDGP